MAAIDFEEIIFRWEKTKEAQVELHIHI